MWKCKAHLQFKYNKQSQLTMHHQTEYVPSDDNNFKKGEEREDSRMLKTGHGIPCQLQK